MASDEGGLEGVSWCPNLDCLSNHALRSLRQVGPSSFVCLVCGATLHLPLRNVRAHRAAHEFDRS